MYEVSSVSCASAGNCTAADSTDFAVSQRHGRWGKPEKIPGLTDDTLIESLSCAAPGDCAVGGSARIGSVDGGFVAVQHNGIWGKAEPVPGLAALNTGRFSYVMSVSCRAAGNCSAGGYGGYAFVVSQATRPAARPSHL